VGKFRTPVSAFRELDNAGPDAAIPFDLLGAGFDFLVDLQLALKTWHYPRANLFAVNLDWTAPLN
jgi:hypothetical protein